MNGWKNRETWICNMYFDHKEIFEDIVQDHVQKFGALARPAKMREEFEARMLAEVEEAVLSAVQNGDDGDVASLAGSYKDIDFGALFDCDANDCEARVIEITDGSGDLLYDSTAMDLNDLRVDACGELLEDGVPAWAAEGSGEEDVEEYLDGAIKDADMTGQPFVIRYPDGSVAMTISVRNLFADTAEAAPVPGAPA